MTDCRYDRLYGSYGQGRPLTEADINACVPIDLSCTIYNTII